MTDEMQASEDRLHGIIRSRKHGVRATSGTCSRGGKYKGREELETEWTEILFFKTTVGRNKNTALIICQSCLDTEGQLVSFFCTSLSPCTFILA